MPIISQTPAIPVPVSPARDGIVLTRSEPPEGMALLDVNPETGGAARLDEMTRKMERLSKLGELSHAIQRLDQLALKAKFHLQSIERRERLLAVPPVPAEELTGLDAAKAMALGKAISAEHGHPFPPSTGETSVFSDGTWVYTVDSDGKATRSRSGVPTPQQWADTLAELNRAKDSFDWVGLSQQSAALEKRIGDLRAELGPDVDRDLTNMSRLLTDFFA